MPVKIQFLDMDDIHPCRNPEEGRRRLRSLLSVGQSLMKALDRLVEEHFEIATKIAGVDLFVSYSGSAITLGFCFSPDLAIIEGDISWNESRSPTERHFDYELEVPWSLVREPNPSDSASLEVRIYMNLLCAIENQVSRKTSFQPA